MNDNDPKTTNPPIAWQPPPGFVPTTSALPGVEVYAPAPQEPEPERRQFKCPRCGASTAYSASETALTCAHCGYVETPQAPIVGRQAEQAEFTVETLDQAARGWGQTRREMHCESCGADLSLAPGELTTTCPFCASHRVVAREETHKTMLRPGHLIPFLVDAPGGVRQLREWLAQGWMHPPALRQVASSARLSGVYLPFWVFSARLNTAWKAQVGRKHTRKTWDGKRKTEIKWKWRSGRLNVRVSDMLTPGTSKVNPRLLNHLYPFDLEELTVYDPAYLAGWQAQAYDVSLRPAWDQARNWMRERARQAVQRDINARYVRNLSMTADLEDERWRYVLLPVYLAAYRFGDKTYQVMVNGQSGKVSGQKPVSWRRVGGALAALLVPGLVLVLLSGLLSPDVAGCSLMPGFAALAIGLALAWRVLRQAMAASEV
jgi:ribosomal protein S27AE/predicted heme/steroid binding protein